MSKDKYIKPIDNSEEAYARLKPITDAAQAGALEPWSPSVIDLLARYKVNVQRLEDVKAQANLSFPTSIKDHESMAVGFRYAKEDGTFTEDLFLFVEDVGLTCYYRGSQEEALPEYADTHHAKIVLSELLPDFQREIAHIQHQVNTIKAQSVPRTNSHSVEIITDEEFTRQKQDILAKHKQAAHSFQIRFSGSSAAQAAGNVVKVEADREIADLAAKKKTSDRFYELEQMDINDLFDKEYKDKASDLRHRNVLTGGFGQQELVEIRKRHRRELEKLALKYGKSLGE
jgi:hypothetical protein